MQAGVGLAVCGPQARGVGRRLLHDHVDPLVRDLSEGAHADAPVDRSRIDAENLLLVRAAVMISEERSDSPSARGHADSSQL